METVVAGYEDPRDSGCLTGLRRMPSSPSTAAIVVGPGELRDGDGRANGTHPVNPKGVRSQARSSQVAGT